MAKTRPGSKSHKSSKGTKSSARNKTRDAPATISPRVLVAEAETAMTQGDVDAALAAAQRAQKCLEDSRTASANNTNIVVDGVGLAAVHALVGEIYLEQGNVEAARRSLRQAVDLDTDGTLPDSLGGGVDKYLYLAQLSDDGGRDSLAWFERGLAGLRARGGQLVRERRAERAERAERGGMSRAKRDGEEDAADDDESDELTIVNGKMAAILCAMAEVWMTDLSYEDDCEQQCEQLTTEATLVDPRSTEAWQTLASVRISQQRDDEARAALERSLELWEDLPLGHLGMPPFGVRVSLVRMLMTVGWAAKAIDVATTLLRDDEQSVEVWYLAGYANYLMGSESEGESEKTAAWTEARRCLGRCLRRFAQQQYEDERLGAHAQELMQELVAAVGEPPQEEQDEEDDDWEEVEDGGDDDEEEDEKMED